ncbi:NAD(P)-dependent oxidoreductase [Paenibacillus cymbidii]|uniref:NAD(P)-dependent oxidoreductase n=1 Tax=Paenibacillus cymbidii TaxID=1639034 RepID=UPI001F428438|nr:NAD(P)-dependent oxidoreductase [Paenibacillus cymbidii]
MLILMAGVFESVPDALGLLRERGFDVIFNPTGNSYCGITPFRELLPELDALVLGGGKLDESLFAEAKKLRVIASLGSGTDHIPLGLARQHGVAVVNTRGANASAVAELAIGHLIGLLRRIAELNSATKRGEWAGAMANMGREIRGKRVGLLGFGLVAQAFARKLQAFDADVYACDTMPNVAAALQYGVRFAAFDEIVEQSDILSLHMPGLADGQPLLGAGQFARMKDGVYLLNTARANLIDTAALAEAIGSGKVAAAAIDVYDREPVDPANPLLALERVVATPHIGASTYECVHDDCMLAVQAIVDVFEGKTPRTLVN